MFDRYLVNTFMAFKRSQLAPFYFAHGYLLHEKVSKKKPRAHSVCLSILNEQL